MVMCRNASISANSDSDEDDEYMFDSVLVLYSYMLIN